MFNKLFGAVGSALNWFNTKKFPDGSVMRQIGRDEVLYQKMDGRSVVMYVFITGTGAEFGRILAKESIRKWSEPYSHEKISESEQQQIIARLMSYFKRDKIGLLKGT